LRKGLDPEDHADIGHADPTVRFDLKGESYLVDLDPEQARQLREIAEGWGLTPVALAKDYVLYGLANQR
jgi:hypothetical protein